ncbi:exported hypothetical protein [Arthrobacter sp. 8AJ]|nr:exported hypothetical protein [Arthrobacter sp. 8AJ]
MRRCRPSVLPQVQRSLAVPASAQQVRAGSKQAVQFVGAVGEAPQHQPGGPRHSAGQRDAGQGPVVGGQQVQFVGKRLVRPGIHHHQRSEVAVAFHESQPGDVVERRPDQQVVQRQQFGPRPGFHTDVVPQAHFLIPEGGAVGRPSGRHNLGHDQRRRGPQGHGRPLPVAGFPVGDELVRHEFQPRLLPEPQNHPLLGKRARSPVNLGGGLGGQQQVSPVLDFNIEQEQVRPKISPARIHDHITNLPGVIEVMRPHNPQGTPMVLMLGKGSPTTNGDPKLKLAHRGPISGRGWKPR